MKSRLNLILFLISIVFISGCSPSLFGSPQVENTRRGVVLETIPGLPNENGVYIGENVEVRADLLNYGPENVNGIITLTEISSIREYSNLNSQQQTFELRGSQSNNFGGSDVPTQRIAFEPFRYIGDKENLKGKFGFIKLKASYNYFSTLTTQFCISDIGERKQGNLINRCPIQETINEGSFQGASASPISVENVVKQIFLSDQLVTLKIKFSNKGGGELEGAINVNANLIGIGTGICKPFQVINLDRIVVCEFRVPISNDPVQYQLSLRYDYPYSSVKTIKLPVLGEIDEVDNNKFNKLPGF